MLFHGLVVIAFGHLTIIGLTYGLIDEKNSIWQKLDWAWRKIMRRQINDNIRDSTLNVLQTADEIPYNELLQGKKKGIYANCRNPKDAVLTFDDGIHP